MNECIHHAYKYFGILPRRTNLSLEEHLQLSKVKVGHLPDSCPHTDALRTNAPFEPNVAMFDVTLTEKNFKSVSEVLWAFTDIVT